MTSPSYWPDSTAHLAAADPVMARLIAAYPGETLSTQGNAFPTLARSITSQQISVKAAESIWKRMEQGIKERHKNGITPHAVRAMEMEALRGFGLSQSKVHYLHSLSDFFLERENATGHGPERLWSEMEDEAVIRDLTAVKGIGRWTAEMFLIFHLMRPDIFPVGDLGVLKAVERAYETKLYTREKKLKRRTLDKITAPWRPYRTVATWYLWRSLDPVAVKY